MPTAKRPYLYIEVVRMGNPMFDKEWFRLDNAAKIYPAAKSSGWNAVFRMSAVMKEKVDGEKLQLALKDRKSVV